MFELGWYKNASIIKSPNFNTRPDNTKISLAVVHCISLPEGKYDNRNVEQLFTNSLDIDSHVSFHDLAGVKVSAHFYIKRSGEIVQFVSVNDRAWHAGISSHNGIKSCNDYSVGVELQGTDSTVYEEQQYRSLNELLRDLQHFYPSIGDIVAHSDIAPNRKTDPGHLFNWRKVEFSRK